ncbi:MAG: hypothetical protein ACSHXK_12425 [Oceanococcus sp.]
MGGAAAVAAGVTAAEGDGVVSGFAGVTPGEDVELGLDDGPGVGTAGGAVRVGVGVGVVSASGLGFEVEIGVGVIGGGSSTGDVEVGIGEGAKLGTGLEPTESPTPSLDGDLLHEISPAAKTHSRNERI